MYNLVKLMILINISQYKAMGDIKSLASNAQDYVDDLLQEGLIDSFDNGGYYITENGRTILATMSIEFENAIDHMNKS